MKTITFYLLFFLTGSFFSQNVTVAISTDCNDLKVIELINNHIKQQPNVKASLFCTGHNLFLVRVASSEVQIKDQFLNNIKSVFTQYQFDYKDSNDPNLINQCGTNSDFDIKEKIKLNE